MECSSREGAGELGRLTNALCQLWPLPYELAKERELAPLPAGWTEHMRQEYGAVYYFNAHTQESSWSKRPPP